MHKLGMIAFSLLLFAMAWRRDEYIFVVFIAIFIAGAAIAMQFRPLVGRIIADARGPSLSEIGALLLGTMLAFCALSLVDGWLDLYRLSGRPLGYMSFDTPARRFEMLLVWLLWVGWTAVAVAPAVRTMFRRRDADGNLPLWPGAIGLVASLPIGFGIFVFWMKLGDAVVRGRFYIDDSATLVLMLPILALMFAPGFFLWAQGWRAVPGDRLALVGVLGATIRAFAVAWAVVGAASLLGILVAMTSQTRGWPGEALSVSCTLLLPVALAWVAGLWRLMGPESCGPLRAAVSWAVLILAWLLSIVLTAMTYEAREWAPLMLLLGLPVVAVQLVVVGLLVPWILRRTIRGAAPRPAFA